MEREMMPLKSPVSTYRLSNKSKRILKTVHPDLASVVSRAIEITEVDFTVLEGVRTLSRQEELFKSKATRTMRSRHLANPIDGLARAVDLGAYVNGSVKWDWDLYHKIADAMFKAAKELGIEIEWGGHWKSFPDGPHYQLPWSKYP